MQNFLEASETYSQKFLQYLCIVVKDDHLSVDSKWHQSWKIQWKKCLAEPRQKCIKRDSEVDQCTQMPIVVNIWRNSEKWAWQRM